MDNNSISSLKLKIKNFKDKAKYINLEREKTYNNIVNSNKKVKNRKSSTLINNSLDLEKEHL